MLPSPGPTLLGRVQSPLWMKSVSCHRAQPGLRADCCHDCASAYFESRTCSLEHTRGPGPSLPLSFLARVQGSIVSLQAESRGPGLAGQSQVPTQGWVSSPSSTLQSPPHSGLMDPTAGLEIISQDSPSFSVTPLLGRAEHFGIAKIVFPCLHTHTATSHPPGPGPPP